MRDSNAASVSGGRNIALKVPEHLYEQTVSFYRDILKLKLISRQDGQISFEFGSADGELTLWLDRVKSSAQSDVWLELNTPDVASAKRYFTSHGVTMRDDVEKLPSDFPGFWIADPVGRIFLVTVPGS